MIYYPYPSPPVRRRYRWVRSLLRYLASLVGVCVCSCATTRTTLPDGTVIEERKPAIKDDTKRFAADVIRALSPMPMRAREVQPTK